MKSLRHAAGVAILGALSVVGGASRAQPSAAAAATAQRPGRFPALSAGKLLVASRSLVDPNFAHTVVLLVVHEPDGAAGLIVNRRSAMPVIRLFGDDGGGSLSSDAMVFLGGPVSRDAVIALVQSKAPLDDARPVTRDIHVLTTREAMEKRLQASADAAVFRVYLGRAGWSPGQLEREVAVGAWHVYDADAAVVFDPDPDTLWDRQIRRSTWLQASLRRPLAAH